MGALGFVVPLFFLLCTMPPKKVVSKKVKASPSGSENPCHASIVPSSPDRLKVASQDEPLVFSGAAAVSNPPAPVYVTEDALSSALVGLEQRLAALFSSSSQSGDHRVGL